mgnify:CR=1 FL=1
MEEQKKKEPEKFKEFYIEYNFFLKEGVCHDYKFMDQISKLLLFESSARDAGDLISFDDYLSRCNPEQKNVYYLVAPTREAALSSPYYETFKKHGTEVLFLYVFSLCCMFRWLSLYAMVIISPIEWCIENPWSSYNIMSNNITNILTSTLTTPQFNITHRYSNIDDFVMGNVKTFSGRPLVSAETSSVDLSKEKPAEAPKAEGEDSKDAEDAAGSDVDLTEAEVTVLSEWLKKALGDRVREVRTTNRLSDSPACVTDHESGALRRMMKMVDQSNTGTSTPLPPQVLEINPSHPIIKSLSAAAAAQAESGEVSLTLHFFIEAPCKHRHIVPLHFPILLASYVMWSGACVLQSYSKISLA